jgi:hypothetical protein
MVLAGWGWVAGLSPAQTLGWLSRLRLVRFSFPSMGEQCIHGLLGDRKWAFGPQYMKRTAVFIRAATGHYVNVVSGFSRPLLHGVHALFALDGVNDRTTLQEFSGHALLPRLLFRLHQNDSTRKRPQWAESKRAAALN